MTFHPQMATLGSVDWASMTITVPMSSFLQTLTRFILKGMASKALLQPGAQRNSQSCKWVSWTEPPLDWLLSNIALFALTDPNLISMMSSTMSIIRHAQSHRRLHPDPRVLFDWQLQNQHRARTGLFRRRSRQRQEKLWYGRFMQSLLLGLYHVG